MLIEFRVQNHRSLLEEQVLTMEAGAIGDPEDPRPRELPGHDRPLLPAAALYGANASGKSNLLAAFTFMRGAVAYSHRSWDPDGGIPREPFAWGRGERAPSLFEVTLLIDGVRYQYGFVADDLSFREEWLYAWPKRRKQVWFERDAQVFKFGEQLRGENRVIEQVTRPNALFLSAAAQNRHEQLGVVHRWFQRTHLHGMELHTVGFWPFFVGRRDSFQMRWLDSALGLPESGGQLNLFDEDDDDSYADASARAAMLKSLLHAADTGIVDVRATRVDNSKRSPIRIEFRHQGGGRDSGWLALPQESHGTITVFQLAPYILDALHRGTLLVVDELESSLHPLLARRIVDLFNSPKTNPRNGQIVFATHNTSLVGRVVGESLLRRDQIWLTEKSPKGATCVYPLTEYKPRKAENLERGYLQGRYGGIPLLGNLVQPK